MNKTILDAVSLLLLLSLCGCSAAAMPQSTPAPSPTPTTVSTPSPTPMPTPTPIPTPTPAPVHTPDYDKVNQQMQDFLNKEGDYDPDNPLFKAQLCVDNEISGSICSLYVLSLDLEYGTALVQLWLFDYYENDGNLILTVGFDGKDGKRHITAINIPMNKYKDYFGFFINNMDQWRQSTHYTTLLAATDIADVEKYLKQMINEPLFFDFRVDKIPEEFYDQIGEENKEFIEFADSKAPLAYNLIEKILVRKGSDSSLKDNGGLLYEINDIRELNDLDPDILPCCYGITAVFEKRELSGKQLDDFFK